MEQDIETIESLPRQPHGTTPLAQTPLGTIAKWPQSLRVAVELTLEAQLPMFLIWGTDRILIYNAAFAEIAGFLRAHHGWPAENTLRRRAERLIDDSVSPAERLAYFKDYPALSATARFRLAQARRLTGDPVLAAADARAAWTSGGLDPVSEAALQAEFGPLLTSVDHEARLDRLLWRGETSAAMRLLSLVPDDYRAVAAARLALKGGVAVTTTVPEQWRNDAGLVFDEAAAAKRRGDLPAARRIMADYAGTPGLVADPDIWLKLRLELARGAMRDGANDFAYRIAAGHRALALGTPLSEHSLAERQELIDTEWLAGWIALRRLNEPAKALTHFERVTDAALTPVSQSRGQYWSGRAAEAANLDARPYYAAAATHADYYYGQLAAEHLGPTLTIPTATPVTVDRRAREAFERDDLVRIVRDLGELGDRGRQTLFMKALVERAETPVEQRLLVDLGRSIDRPDLGVITGKAARVEGELALVDAAYPTLSLPPELSLSWTLVHAISRQETQFDRAAISGANARGLMQLLPATAAEQAAKLGLPYATSRLTDDPVFNVTLGAAYYGRIRDNLGGSNLLAVAAYNAGPGNVRKFIAMNGDPRLPGADLVDWVELIPFSETRDYVQRVLANAVVYDIIHPATSTMPATNRLSAYLGKRVPG